MAGTCKVREGPKPEEREAVERLDKGAEEVLDWLDACGGRLALEELAEIVGCRARDLRGEGRPVAKLEDARVIVVEEGTVSLAEDWLERLEDRREVGGEDEAAEYDRVRYELDRMRYRQRLEDAQVEKELEFDALVRAYEDRAGEEYRPPDYLPDGPMPGEDGGEVGERTAA